MQQRMLVGLSFACNRKKDCHSGSRLTLKIKLILLGKITVWTIIAEKNKYELKLVIISKPV